MTPSSLPFPQRGASACTYPFPWEALKKGKAEKCTAVQPALIQLFLPCKSRGLYQCATVSTRKKGNSPEGVWEPGLSVLTMIFSLHRAAMCSGFPGYFFFPSCKSCIAELEDFIYLLKRWNFQREVETSNCLSRIPGYPAASLRIAVAGLLAFLVLSQI